MRMPNDGYVRGLVSATPPGRARAAENIAAKRPAVSASQSRSCGSWLRFDGPAGPFGPRGAGPSPCMPGVGP
ncbi:hypothetical protein CHLRE_16g661876v5 [Chlamydomonas reinhardtii]|uniref:Uncharacterized protein n=1 Tax=Chlamydomonas reinhardtii TaxID=3055 RepID=A0A2K3CTN4_CHLRE|nr:uncharacterized protein CHLRE_16g661876v5 [Chlamydomonas reinhardtii]PNW71621.1 hypothetical protein CHLRE_16g661876v5 [Chlamydomonas reinhardtii]